MARTIYRYEVGITDEISISMPQGSEILTVATSRTDAMRVEMWAIVDPMFPQVNRRFYIIGTGHAMPKAVVNYVGTIQTFDGRLVFHVFEHIANA